MAGCEKRISELMKGKTAQRTPGVLEAAVKWVLEKVTVLATLPLFIYLFIILIGGKSKGYRTLNTAYFLGGIEN